MTSSRLLKILFGSDKVKWFSSRPTSPNSPLDSPKNLEQNDQEKVLQPSKAEVLLPPIGNYLEANGAILRQKAEKYLLDVLVFHFGQGVTVAAVAPKGKFAHWISEEVGLAVKKTALEDPSWRDVFAPGRNPEAPGYKSDEELISQALVSFVEEFCARLETRRCPSRKNIDEIYTQTINERMLRDFETARVEIQKLQKWDRARVMRKISPQPLSTPVGFAPKPVPQLYGVSHYGAEILVRDWMRHLGYSDAEVTQMSGDGGIDVATSRHIVQVKNYKDSVGVSALRELLGVSVSENKQPLLFTSGSLTAAATEFADRNSIYAFHYSAERGSLRAINHAGERFIKASLQQFPTQAISPFEAPLSLLQEISKMMRAFMANGYALVATVNFVNSHREDFSLNSGEVKSLLLDRAELEKQILMLQAEILKLTKQFEELVSNKEATEDLFRIELESKLICSDFAEKFEAIIQLSLNIFEALGISLSTSQKWSFE